MTAVPWRSPITWQGEPGDPTVTYDLATDLGKVRALIPDTDPAAPIFADEHLQAFLDLEGAVKLAAAQALEVLASDRAMVLQVIRDKDLTTDGAKLAAELRARAAGLRSQHAAGLEAEADDGGFAVVDFDPAYCGPELAERWCG